MSPWQPMALAALPLLASCVVAAVADDGLDVLYLVDGTELRGTVLGVDGGAYRVQAADGATTSVAVAQVVRLEPGPAATSDSGIEEIPEWDPQRIRVGFDLYLLGGGLRVEKPYERHGVRSFGFRLGAAGGLGGSSVTYGAVMGYGNFFVTFMPGASWSVEVSSGPVVGVTYGDPVPAWGGGFAFLIHGGDYVSFRAGLNGAATIPGTAPSYYVGWFWPELGVSAAF